jgi:hypothetical protein
VIRFVLAGVAVVLVLVLLAGLPLLRLWRRPTLRRATGTGMWLSLLVIVPWSLMADLTIGTAAPLDLTRRDLPGSYVRLAAGPTGNAAELAAVVIGICVACSVLAGWRSKPRQPPASDPLPAPPPAPALTAPAPALTAPAPALTAPAPALTAPAPALTAPAPALTAPAPAGEPRTIRDGRVSSSRRWG